MAEMDDAACRRLGAIFPGRALDDQLRNAEYLESRGGGSYASLQALRRAKELRALDAIADEASR